VSPHHEEHEGYEEEADAERPFLFLPLQEIEWVILTISRVEVGGTARLKLCSEAWRRCAVA
jgi:hypothetical protein